METQIGTVREMVGRTAIANGKQSSPGGAAHAWRTLRNEAEQSKGGGDVENVQMGRKC